MIPELHGERSDVRVYRRAQVAPLRQPFANGLPLDESLRGNRTLRGVMRRRQRAGKSSGNRRYGRCVDADQRASFEFPQVRSLPDMFGPLLRSPDSDFQVALKRRIEGFARDDLLHRRSISISYDGSRRDLCVSRAQLP